MDDKNVPIAGDWTEAARKTEQSWDKKTGEIRNSPEQSSEDSMERTEEGYGSGKEGADPGTNDDGRTPASPAN